MQTLVWKLLHNLAILALVCAAVRTGEDARAVWMGAAGKYLIESLQLVNGRCGLLNVQTLDGEVSH